MKETVYQYILGKGKAFATFIDLSKAFDLVDHFVLGDQLLERNIPPDIVLLLMCYLRNQSARVCWNKHSGSYIDIEKGVRQGGILSPFLFKLYLDATIRNISSQDTGCQLGFLRLNIIAYADDLVVLADSQKNLEYLYGVLERELKSLKLVMNKRKSKCMIFGKTVGSGDVSTVSLAGDTFEVVREYKYLGHFVNECLSEERDISFRLNNFYSKFNSLFRNFNKVSIETFMYLFNSYCVPDYGLGLWNPGNTFNKQIFKAFETAYSNALKKIIGVPVYSSSHITADLCGQLLFKHHVSFIQARYMKRVLMYKNEITLLCSPYLRNGCLCKYVISHFKNTYDCDFYENDLEILRARVEWLQRHESRRGIFKFNEI